MVFMWYFRTRGGGRDLSTAGRSFENKMHSVLRWRAVCIAISGQLQFGAGVLFILWRYEWKLPWFVRNCVRRKMGHSERESLWKMVGMNSLVWQAFAEFTDFCIVVFQCLLSWNDWDYIVSDGSTVAHNCFGQVVCCLVKSEKEISMQKISPLFWMNKRVVTYSLRNLVIFHLIQVRMIHWVRYGHYCVWKWTG